MIVLPELDRLDTLTPESVAQLSDQDLIALTAQLVGIQAHDRQTNALRYYQPVSARAYQIHHSTARTIGVGGGNGCEPAGTRVMTLRGMLPIESVIIGDRVPGRGRWPGQVIGTYISPTPVPVYKITTKRGYTMQGSGDHLNYVCGARRRAWHNAIDADRKCTWKRLDELSAVDFERVPTFIKLSASASFPNRCSITADDAYFLGQMVGDGHWLSGTTNMMSWTTHDQDIVTIAWMEQYLSRRGIHVWKGKKNQSYGVVLSWCSKQFRILVESWGVTRTLGPLKDVPDSVWTGTKAVMAAFIRGLADSDGCATTKPSVVIVNQSEPLLRGVQILLRNFKITCSLRWQPPVGGPKHENGIWRLEVAGRNLQPYVSDIGFLLPYKAARLANIKTAKRKHQWEKYDRIVKIERVENQTVYGLTITPKPEYLADGFLQHNSSKTESCLVEMVIRATGQIPLSLRDSYPREKLRGPIACRVVVESLTTTLFPTILPKLDGRRWSGVDEAGGVRGHWGWIPKDCLIHGEWDKSWKAHERILRCYYRHPDQPDKILGESTVQFMSYDQDPSDFASGDFHFILHDEPPKEAIWIENIARTMRVNGTRMVAMTWPDDPTIAVDWILDRLYYPAQPGPQHDPAILWVNLDTTENQNLNQTAVAEDAKHMTATERATRILGQPITLSNRVHPLFTDEHRTWCFGCHDLAILNDSGACGRCGERDVLRFQHVVPCVAVPNYPVIQVLDPHPRKPHMLLWLQVTPEDDLEQIAELEVNDVPSAVWSQVQDLEAEYGWTQISRLMDPNMGRSASGTDRTVTWQDAFDAVGMRIDLADDGEVGRRLFNDYLKPDPHTRQPRYRCDPRNVRTIYQLKRYCWDDFKRTAEKGQKQRPKQKHDDYPTMIKYATNSNPSFRGLAQMGSKFTSIGHRHNGY